MHGSRASTGCQSDLLQILGHSRKCKETAIISHEADAHSYELSAFISVTVHACAYAVQPRANICQNACSLNNRGEPSNLTQDLTLASQQNLQHATQPKQCKHSPSTVSQTRAQFPCATVISGPQRSTCASRSTPLQK